MEELNGIYEGRIYLTEKMELDSEYLDESDSRLEYIISGYLHSGNFLLAKKLFRFIKNRPLVIRGPRSDCNYKEEIKNFVSMNVSSVSLVNQQPVSSVLR